MLRTFSIDAEPSPLDGADLTALAFSPHRFANGRGPYVATGTGRGHDPVALWNYTVGRCEALLEETGGHQQAGTMRQTSTLALARTRAEDQEGEVTGEKLLGETTRRPHSNNDDEDEDEEEAGYTVIALTFLGDRPLLAVSCSDGHIRVWTAWAMLGTRRACVLRFANQEVGG